MNKELNRQLIKRCEQLCDKYEKVVKSKKDAEIFFDAITNPREPNEALKKAAKDLKQWIDEKE